VPGGKGKIEVNGDVDMASSPGVRTESSGQTLPHWTEVAGNVVSYKLDWLRWQMLESRVLRKNGELGVSQERLRVTMDGRSTISRALGTRSRARASGALSSVIAAKNTCRNKSIGPFCLTC